MRVKVIDADAFSYIFRTLEEFIDEITLDFTSDGLKIRGIDPSRVTFIDILIPAGYFEEYDVEKEEKVGVKLEDFTDVLKTVTKNDSLYLETDENQNIKVTLDGVYERTFTFPSIVASEIETPNLNLEFPFKAKALTVTFTDIIDEIEDIGGDSITFKAEGGKLYLSANSDMGSSTIELSTENGGLLESEGSDAESVYGLEYVINTSKMRKPSDTVEIAFGSQIPLKLRYNLPQGGYADFYIAPRAE
ncbi:DNA polymerase sliding clamp [Sulfolobus sp. S-194]|uniref:DNA polymerase sliding clamp Pcn3 n=1 Tax=Sulfolobus sp. S-194 TaxID=2512240 RepID=UPI00143714FC|nr:DNA polymerase sliding clamp Pcn3 [Sulfolobus sp. S-194]QIW24059.1 DNA polymerase sliding clamp [Sulfolobus sp. S-194]